MQIKENFDAFEDLVPPITELNKSYRENLAKGRLILQACAPCGKNQYPFESFCYECGSTDLTEVSSTGEGSVYSFVKVHQPYHPAFKPFIPYFVSTVQLDDGPRMLAAMFESDDVLEIGDRVAARIEKISETEAMLLFEKIRVGN